MARTGNKCRYCSGVLYRIYLCQRHYLRRRWKRNKKKLSAAFKAWYKRRREYNKLRWQRYYAANTERLRAKGRKQHRENRSVRLRQQKAYRQKNGPLFLFYDQLKRAHKQRKLALFHRAVTLLVYKKRPKNKVVDHILPLKNKHVCGLHVAWNMQYLTPTENSKKFNKFDFTYDNQGWRTRGKNWKS